MLGLIKGHEMKRRRNSAHNGNNEKKENGKSYEQQMVKKELKNSHGHLVQPSVVSALVF